MSAENYKLTRDHMIDSIVNDMIEDMDRDQLSQYAYESLLYCYQDKEDEELKREYGKFLTKKEFDKAKEENNG